MTPQYNKLTTGQARNYTKALLYSCFFVFVVVCCGVLTARSAEAASLYFSPSSTSVTVGKTVSVSIVVSSPGQSINAISSRISFDQDQLTFVSASKSGSIISLWVQEPTQMDDGTIRPEGVVLNPGWQGSAGRVVTLTFKAKAAGSAAIRFVSGSILANDGKGTNVLAGLGSAQVTINAQAVGPQPGETTSPVESAGVPLAPRVSSATHPDPNKWYTNDNPTFTWGLSSDITGVNVLADHEPTTNPGTSSDGLRSSYTYQNVDDGTWYFHIRLRNASGWGAVSHFRFQIDTQKPEVFAVTFPEGAATSNPTPRASFTTSDQPSGIAAYLVKVGDDDFIRVPPASLTNSTYTLPVQEPGAHTLLVQAVDQAGNYVTASGNFEVRPLPAPTVDYPSELAPGDPLIMKGHTLPGATVRLTLQASAEPQSQEAVADGSGAFTLAWGGRLKPDSYQVLYQAIDSHGAKSLAVQGHGLVVHERALVRAGQVVLSYLTVLVTLISLLLALVLAVLYGTLKARNLRRRLRREVSTVEQVLHKSFKILRADLKSHLKLLERARTKRELTLEEEKISTELQKALDTTEQVVSRELEDIEREVKG